jgi:uncharacterized protein (DUF2267 family)
MTEKIETLNSHLQDLQLRHAEIATEMEAATDALDLAREAVVSGKGKTPALIAAQSACDALRGALEALAERITAQRTELQSAEAQAKRESDLAALEAAKRNHEEARTEIENQIGVVASAIATAPEIAENYIAFFRTQREMDAEAQRLNQPQLVNSDVALNIALRSIECEAMREAMRTEIALQVTNQLDKGFRPQMERLKQAA